MSVKLKSYSSSSHIHDEVLSRGSAAVVLVSLENRVSKLYIFLLQALLTAATLEVDARMAGLCVWCPLFAAEYFNEPAE